MLDGVENDARTPDKLVDGSNDTYDASHMWLAPIFPGVVSAFSALSVKLYLHTI